MVIFKKKSFTFFSGQLLMWVMLWIISLKRLLSKQIDLGCCRSSLRGLSTDQTQKLQMFPCPIPIWLKPIKKDVVLFLVYPIHLKGSTGKTVPDYKSSCKLFYIWVVITDDYCQARADLRDKGLLWEFGVISTSSGSTDTGAAGKPPHLSFRNLTMDGQASTQRGKKILCVTDFSNYMIYSQSASHMFCKSVFT